MTSTRCGICEAGDRDLGILIASLSFTPSQLTNDKIAKAYARLSSWVTHIREMAGAAQAHIAALELPNLSGTAYFRNVTAALANPKLQDPVVAGMRRSQQDELIASALVLLITGTNIWPLGAHREQSERIAISWGWKGPRPDWPSGIGEHVNL
jgi:hypothetical protein